MNPEWVAELAEVFGSMAKAVALVTFMSFVGERLVELFKPVAAPLTRWLQKLAGQRLEADDGWVLMLFALVIQGLVVAATGANAFAPFVSRPWMGSVLTVLAGAGGSNFWHDIWPKRT